MGMLMHHTWLNQQKQNEKPKKSEHVPVETAEEEPAKEPAKRSGGRRKTK